MLIREMYQAVGHESLSVTGTATGFTAAQLSRTGGQVVGALLTAETAQMRYCVDGTTATSTVGHLLETGDVLEIWGANNLAKFSVIRTGGTSGTLKVTYFGA